MNAIRPTQQPSTPARSRPTTHQRHRSTEAFRKRIRSGSFEAVLGRDLRRTLQDAAADPSLDLEIGALRLILVRLLREEPELPRLAAAVARLSSAAVLASRQRADSCSPANELRQVFLKELERFEKEKELEARHATTMSLS